MSSLSRTLDVFDHIASTEKTKDKLSILESNKDKYEVRRAVFYALDFTKKYGVKKFPPDICKLRNDSNPDALFSYLDSLASKRGTCNLDVTRLAGKCSSDKELELVKRIVNKDLRCGVSLKQASKIFYDLPSKDIMLCAKAARVVVRKGKKTKISEDLENFVENCGGWKNVGVSTKENGVRDKIVCDDNCLNISHISRNGLTYNNFGAFDEISRFFLSELRRVYNLNSSFLDGEVVSMDEDFQNQMTQIRRLESVDSSIFRLRLFDIGGTNLSQRKREEILSEIYGKLDRSSRKLVDLVLCVKCSDTKSFLNLYDTITNKDKKEGVVLKNLKGKYENKRSNNWCKVKTFYSEDLVVLKAIKGKEGKKYAGTLGALLVDFRGVKVKVGSGYSDEERERFLQNPPKVIEVEYKEITKDGSLFHPSFVRVREDK